MKKIIICAALLLTAGTAKAENLLNFGDFFHALRAGYAINQHGQKSDIFYTALQTFHSTAGVDYGSVNLGYEGAVKRPAVSTSLRLDNIVPLIWGSEWGKAHVTTAKMPTFEFGPYVSAWPKDNSNLWNLDVWYGLSFAIGF